MSSGHNHKGEQIGPVSDALYAKVAALIDAATINRSYEIKYLSNRSRDGRTVYIDKRVPKVMKCGIKPDQTLPWHELAEWGAENDGESYVEAHNTVATPVEHRRVEELIPGVWKRYEEEMDGIIEEVDATADTNMPSDIDRRPYDEPDKAPRSTS